MRVQHCPIRTIQQSSISINSQLIPSKQQKRPRSTLMITEDKGEKRCVRAGRLGHTNNRVATRILVTNMDKKTTHWRDVCSSSSSPKKPRWPSIPPGQFRRCQSRLPLDVLVLCSLAAMLELTLYLSLVVRRWCWAFLFGPPFDGGGLCGECVPACRYSTHPPGEQGLAFASGISPEFALVPPFGMATFDAEMSCLRNWFSHSTSTSASPVTSGFANTDMKGCPIWCPLSALSPPRCKPFPTPWLLRAVGMRPRLPPPATCDRETLRVDVWIGHTVVRARLDDRSEVRRVRDDVSVTPPIDSPVFSRSHSLHLRYLESPLPSSDRRMRSEASARFWLSMTLFGLQRFHPFVSLPSGFSRPDDVVIKVGHGRKLQQNRFSMWKRR